MKKAIVIALALGSCGTTKKTVHEVKKDSISIKAKEIVNTTILTFENYTRKIVPIDTAKAMIINGVSYRNVVLQDEKTKDVKEVTEIKKEVDVEQKKSSTLATEKESFSFNWFYIIAFVLLVVGFLSRFIM